jgi:hypothetical protein
MSQTTWVLSSCAALMVIVIPALLSQLLASSNLNDDLQRSSPAFFRQSAGLNRPAK